MATASTTAMAPLELVLPFCTTAELSRISLLDREHARVSELEWRQRVLARFGTLRFRTRSWRKCFKLRAHFARKVVDAVSARVYVMNGRGETHFFPIASATSLMCSRERAVVYNRCERMFDLSLRINRSIQEISALIGIVSLDDARGLLTEHINLMASVASLRSSLLFESELFQVFPAPVLLDANALLRATFEFPTAGERVDSLRFIDSSTLMMQVWASIDGRIYRPLAPPTVLEPLVTNRSLFESVPSIAPVPAIAIAPAAPLPTYSSVKLHDLAGMTIAVDDNTLRYRLLAHELCVNALVSNAYLLYLFNPLQFRPLDWTFHAVVHVNAERFELPVQREGVFLNTTTHALRVFLSYGQIPVGSTGSTGSTGSNTSRARGGDNSAPLAIPFDDGEQLVFFHLSATNRITHEVREVAAKTACLAARDASDDVVVVPVDATSSDDGPDGLGKSSTAAPEPAMSTERHVHLPFDAMICYSFASTGQSLQYVEFAIGFEPLMHRLGIADFLDEPPVAPSTPVATAAAAAPAAMHA